MKTIRRSTIILVIFALILSVTPYVSAAEVSDPPPEEPGPLSDSSVTVTSNMEGNDDLIVIDGLTPDDIIKIYADAELSILLDTATADENGQVSFAFAQLIAGDAAGAVYITVTDSVSSEESDAVEVTIPAAGVSATTATAYSITVTNSSSGTSDTIIVSGLQQGDKIRVYADEYLTALLGTGTASATGAATVKIPQLSAEDASDIVYITVTCPGKLESPALAVDVPTAGLSPALSSETPFTVYSNAAGSNDTIVITGLSQGDKIKVYADQELTSLLGSGTTPATGTCVVSITQLVQGDVAGSVYITITCTGRLESDATEVAVPAAATSDALTSSNEVTVINNAAGLSDIVCVIGLTQGDMVRVYSDVQKMNLMGSAIAGAAGEATVSVSQLTQGDAAGVVYVTVTGPGTNESNPIEVTVPAALASTSITAANPVTVTNNAGVADIVVVEGLSIGDKIRVYSDELLINLLGTATAGAAGTATVNIPQLVAGDATGFIYITVTKSGALESPPATVEVPSANSTAPLSEANAIVVTNNAIGTNDTVVVNGLVKGDKIRVYNDAGLTTQLGTATAAAYGSVTVSITQLMPGDVSGTIYITVTNAAAMESTAFAVAVDPAKSTAPLAATNEITVINNAAGTSDTIYITRLAQGDKIRVYADSALTMPLGTATAAAAGPVTVTVPQLTANDDAGTIYITVTNTAATESTAVSVEVPAAKTTLVLIDEDDIQVTNNTVGISDVLIVSRLSQGDKIRVFSDALLTNLLGSATATAAGTATVKVAQLIPNDNAGTVYLNVTNSGRLVSSSFPVSVPAVGVTPPLNGFNTMTVNNNAAANDTILIERLAQGDKIRVFSDTELTVLLGSATAASAGALTVTVPQLVLNDAAGIVYVTVTNVGKLESTAVEVEVPSAGVSLPISAGNMVNVINNPVGTSDIITVSGLSQGDKVNVFNDSQLTNLLGSAAAAPTGTATVKILQLVPNDNAGSVYITVKSATEMESSAVMVAVPAARTTAPLSGLSTVTITNNAAGTSDTVLITMLVQGDKIRVYADENLVKLLGSATATSTGTATLSVTQITPNDQAGVVYITVANVGALESDAIPKTVDQARITAAISAFSNKQPINNVGASDKLIIDMLAKGDKVRVYSDSRLTSLLGTATADAAGYATVTVRQLIPKDGAGTVYVTVTNVGALESAAIEVAVPEGSDTTALTGATPITVTNNAAGTSDTVFIEGLAQGDRIKVFSDSRMTSLLGTATASSKGEATVTVRQLTPGDIEGNVYITVTNEGAFESTYLQVHVPAADTSDALAPENIIAVTNNAAGTSDTILIEGLAQGDRIKVFSDIKLTNLLGTAVSPPSGSVTVRISQLIAKDAAGTVYITMTGTGLKESDPLNVPVDAAARSAKLTDDSVITVVNNAAGTSDVIVVENLLQGDRIKVYSDNKLTNLLGTATAMSTGTATVKSAQLTYRDLSGYVYITVTSPGQLESEPYQVAVPLAPTSVPFW